MTIFYSATLLGFVDSDIWPRELPLDAVGISAEEHERLLDGQTAGKRIAPDANGRPALFDQLPLSAEAVRAQRNARLAETDWTQAGDIPQATKERWAAYRQALRDVPAQEGFPTNVQWPNKP